MSTQCPCFEEPCTGSKIDGPQNLADPKYISKCHRLKTEYGPKMFRIDDDDNSS